MSEEVGVERDVPVDWWRRRWEGAGAKAWLVER